MPPSTHAVVHFTNSSCGIGTGSSLPPGLHPQRTSGSFVICSIKSCPERLPLCFGSLSERHRSPDERRCQSIDNGASCHRSLPVPPAPGVRDVSLLPIPL